MTIDLQTINLLAGIAAGVLTSASIIAGFFWFLRRQIEASFERQATEIARIENDTRIAIQAADGRAKVAEEELRRSIEAHKLFAAEHFATEDGVAKALEPVLRAIERLGDRLDQLIAGNTPSRPSPRSRT